MQELLHRLSHGPSSLAGWGLLSLCGFTLIIWFAISLGYGDDAPEAEKKRLGTAWGVIKHFAPPSFIRFTRWFVIALAIIYVVSVYL